VDGDECSASVSCRFEGPEVETKAALVGSVDDVVIGDRCGTGAVRRLEAEGSHGVLEVVNLFLGVLAFGSGRFGFGIGIGSFGSGFGGGLAGGAGMRREVGSGYLEAVEEDAGALDVHLIGGELGEDVADGLLDGGAVLNAFEWEGYVGKDGRHLSGLVVVAGVLVAHGVGAATIAVAVDVDALVELGWFLAEFRIERHGCTPPVYTEFC